jgi:ATP synthase in type III secretion protein N
MSASLLQVGSSSGATFPKSVRLGRVVEVTGSLLCTEGISVRIGELCELTDGVGGSQGLAEVIGFSGEKALLTPMRGTYGIGTSTYVRPMGRTHSIPVGDFLLGAVVDGMGLSFLDREQPMPDDCEMVGVYGAPPKPLGRAPIASPMTTGVRCIDSLLTCGWGQRVGIFAPAGCGKSTLLGMMCHEADADVIIVALIGERGREVDAFLSDALRGEARDRSIVVASTSERPAAERIKAAFVATTYAEHFRDQGKSVLLLVDSVTRLARASRELGLAAGEPQTRRGFPPSTFTLLPALFERAGLTSTGGITGIYTVLEETDDGADPISEEVRSLLDGHIVLSRKLAAKGHFPAIDVLASVSRLMPRVATKEHVRAAAYVREMMAKLDEIELLVRIGEYRDGTDHIADRALALRSEINALLTQDVDEQCNWFDSQDRLMDLTQ